MPSDYSVILYQRQHFGNDRGVFNNVAPSVPFVGPTKDYRFDCPNIDASQTGFITFQSLSVEFLNNVIKINGVDVYGGIPTEQAAQSWNANVLLVESRHNLRSRGNELHIEARNEFGGGGSNLDDFILDNIIITYKTQ